MKDLDLLFNGSICPKPSKVVPFHEHKCSYFAMTLLLKDHVLDNILLEVRVLENLMLHLCDKE